MHDQERQDRLATALQAASLDAVIGLWPQHVLLLSGYWPVRGYSLALYTRSGEAALVVPEEEAQLAHASGQQVYTYAAGSLERLNTRSQAALPVLRAAAAELGLRGTVRIGIQTGELTVPAPYVALGSFGLAGRDLLQEAFGSATLCPADDFFAEQTSVLTTSELDRVRLACQVAEKAFLQGIDAIRAGNDEFCIASWFRTPLSEESTEYPGHRMEGHVWCRAGENSAQAAASYQLMQGRRVQPGDLVLIHCNSHVDGFWTDLTRTFNLGEPGARNEKLYTAVLEARAAAFAAVRPGVRAAEVDQAARDTLAALGLADLFPHGTGHGVGFAAIDHLARPRLHPASDDRLESGMVFNVEPATYIPGYGGIRHCDMVCVTPTGAEWLTQFQSSLESLTLPVESPFKPRPAGPVASV